MIVAVKKKPIGKHNFLFVFSSRQDIFVSYLSVLRMLVLIDWLNFKPDFKVGIKHQSINQSINQTLLYYLTNYLLQANCSEGSFAVFLLVMPVRNIQIKFVNSKH